MSPGRPLSPATVPKRGDFLKIPSPPTSLVVDPWNPPPSSAAPTVGGWGFHESRLVHSVGVGLVPVGGVSEARRLSVWSLVSARSPSGDGAPRSLFVKQLTSSSSEVHGSGELAVPRPGSTGRRSRCLKMKLKVVFGYSASSATSSAVGSSDPAFGDFPLAKGLVPIQGVSPSVFVRRRRQDLEEGLLCKFSFFLGLSVRTEY